MSDDKPKSRIGGAILFAIGGAFVGAFVGAIIGLIFGAIGGAVGAILCAIGGAVGAILFAIGGAIGGKIIRCTLLGAIYGALAGIVGGVFVGQAVAPSYNWVFDGGLDVRYVKNVSCIVGAILGAFGGAVNAYGESIRTGDGDASKDK